jgi:hypothetical protein
LRPSRQNPYFYPSNPSMNKKILLAFFLLSTSQLFAQQTGIEKASDSTCKCLESVKDKIKNTADFNKYGLGCIAKSALPYFEEISKQEGINIDNLDNEEGQKIGRKIGFKLAMTCPLFVDLIKDFDSDDMKTGSGTGKSAAVVSGTVINVELTDHAYITVKDDAGKIFKLVWVQYFEGSDAYKANPLLLKQKKVAITWESAEIYNVKQRDFLNVKAITKLEIR